MKIKSKQSVKAGNIHLVELLQSGGGGALFVLTVVAAVKAFELGASVGEWAVVIVMAAVSVAMMVATAWARSRYPLVVRRGNRC